MSHLATAVRDAFRPGGAVARAYPDYRERPGQQRLADALAHALDTSGAILVAHAPTGIGKTLAYLAPLLLSDRRFIVSTGTVPLQDQIARNDLPRVARLLGRTRTVAVLKGRAHYLCRLRLERQLAAPELEGLGNEGLAEIERWARTDSEGDLDHTPPVSGLARLRERLVTTAEACTGSACPRFADCFVFRARRYALEEADVVIVNHHLLLSDLQIKDEGFGALLPEVHGIVVDEAHRLPDLLFTALAQSHGVRALEEFRRDLARAASGRAPWARDCRALEQRLGALLGRLQAPADGSALRSALSSLRDLLQETDAALGPTAANATGDPDILSLRKRSQEGADFFTCWLDAREDLSEDGDRPSASPSPEPNQANGEGAGGDGPEPPFAWTEGAGAQRVFRLLPEDPRAIFARLVAESRASWAFVSATLAVEDSVEPFAREIGVSPTATLVLRSPFDHARHGLLYVPRGPDVHDPRYLAHYVAGLLDLLDETAGGALFLFTSTRALREAADLLAPRLHGRRRLLVQGEDSRARLLELFRRDGRAVLVATQSFWEGIDVPGSALRLLAIDRLPFASPDDPLSRIKAELARRDGVSAFNTYSLPQAVISLAQGVGRLLRHEDDTGLVVIGDRRLLTMSYGRTFLRSLPPFPLTEDRERVSLFLEGLRADTGA